MADQKISALTAKTPLTGTELIPIVDDPSGTPTSKKTTAQDIADLAGGGGAWELVAYYTGTAIPTTVVTGLDLATDLRYKVLIQIEPTNSGNLAQNYYLRINGITGATYNYMSKYDRNGNGTYATAGTAANATQYAKLNENLFKIYSMEINFALANYTDGSTKKVLWDWVSVGMIQGDDVVSQDKQTGCANETTATNLTSFSLHAHSVTGSPTVAYKIWILKPKTA